MAFIKRTRAEGYEAVPSKSVTDTIKKTAAAVKAKLVDKPEK